jgi:hypothetical protein
VSGMHVDATPLAFWAAALLVLVSGACWATRPQRRYLQALSAYARGNGPEVQIAPR